MKIIDIQQIYDSYMKKFSAFVQFIPINELTFDIRYGIIETKNRIEKKEFL